MANHPVEIPPAKERQHSNMCQASAYMLEVQSQSSNIGGHKSNRNLHLPLLENVLEGHAFHNIQVGAVLKMCHVGLRNASN